MKFFVNPWPYDRWASMGQLIEAVVELERLGFGGVAFPEHPLTLVKQRESYGNVAWPEPFVLSAAMAAVTSRIEFIFKVMVVPLRHPLVTARLAATLDQVSQGRVVLGVGSGWNRDDLRAMGQDFDRRGALTDEYLDVMRACWADGPSTVSGSFGSWEEALVEPKSYRRPQPQLWIGGRGAASVRRTVNFGDGWVPMPAQIPFPEAATAMRSIREKASQLGRAGDDLAFAWRIAVGGTADAVRAVQRNVHAVEDHPSFTARSSEEAVEMVERLRRDGVTHIELTFEWRSPDEFMDAARRLSEDVVMPCTVSG